MNKSKKQTINYLKSLTKEELIDLIINLAPQSFLDNINSKFSPQKNALLIFNQVAKTITSLFNDEELLYSPSQFESKLLTQLEKLRGLWDRLPSEIGDLMITTMENVEQAFEEGYLYLERYGQEDDYFESEEVNQYIVDFVNNLQPEIKSNFLKNLQ